MSAPPSVPGYQVLGLLGQGGMGSVHRAVDGAGRVVALKLLPRGEVTAASLARFAREGELLARCRHPGVVAVHAWGVTDQACYMACELVEGRHLDAAAAGLPLAQQLDLLEAAARAVAAAHALGVVHRDLKPANLLVDGAGQVKVIDFGVATAPGVERLTQTGQFVGTPRYAPPERWVGGEDLDAPTGDVWALAAIAYEVLAGAPP
ncbi:MAG: serine/threonine protein kinase, partial [Planctomycetota bacterium]|nr:serine/threonine protein kinase [Planctomycetota bacterium]